MNLWREGPIKAPCSTLPSLPLSPLLLPLSRLLLPLILSCHTFHHPLILSSAPPMPPNSIFPLRHSVAHPHPSTRPHILSQTDSALAGCVAGCAWFPLDKDFTVGNLRTRAGERCMLPYKEWYYVSDAMWKRMFDLKRIPMVPTEDLTSVQWPHGSCDHWPLFPSSMLEYSISKLNAIQC